MKNNIEEAIRIIDKVRQSMPHCTNKAFLKGASNELNESLRLYNFNDKNEQLLELAMLALDDYLNAGCKETRKQAAEKAKIIYKEYYGKDYVNRTNRI